MNRVRRLICLASADLDQAAVLLRRAAGVSSQAAVERLEQVRFTLWPPFHGNLKRADVADGDPRNERRAALHLPVGIV